jgi:hypothetical protein
MKHIIDLCEYRLAFLKRSVADGMPLERERCYNSQIVWLAELIERMREGATDDICADQETA